MAIEKFTKQAYEQFKISLDFSVNFETGTIISSQVVTATDKNNDDVSNVVIDQSSVTNDGTAIVEVVVRAGSEDLSPYKITTRIIDSVNYQWELDVKMEVKEI